MIVFPIFQALTIENYGLYPASSAEPFVVNFEPGPTAIVGVNGSGKSTLIHIALRCLTGPSTLPAPTTAGELGHIQPRLVALSPQERRFFAKRVADGAKAAFATLRCMFGKRVVEIRRRLSDLSLVSIFVDGKPIQITHATADAEAMYQQEIAKLFHVASAFDVSILLHFLVFMMEDRRTLVWDATAQRQIFRILLPPDRASDYAAAQQEFISADSAFRNTRNVINRRTKRVEKSERAVRQLDSAEAARTMLVAQANVLREQLERASGERSRADADRRDARLAREKAAATRDALLRELEHMKFQALGHRLGTTNDTVKYILTHLLADDECLVCGTSPSPAGAKIDEWVRAGRCPICGSAAHTEANVESLSAGDAKRIARLEQQLELAEAQIDDAEQRTARAHEVFVAADALFIELDARRVDLDAQIVQVLRQIPAERAAVAAVTDDIDALNRLLDEDRRGLAAAERKFRRAVAETVRRVEQLQDDVRRAFQPYVKVFLKENASLLYRTVKAPMGQSGAQFEFPAFQLTMSGGAIAGEALREGPESVSNSQAEFIDLAFRMALMTVASAGSAATLVVDAPEATLDFLFAERAGQQLAKFSYANGGNRVIVTSYLPSEHLLQALFAKTKRVPERRRRIVDLIKDAAPNAAIRADGPRYEEFLEKIISRSGVAHRHA
ncbi:MAG TPA: AAA family ATPase [Thermoanaerobaculia bacterium]|jgi:hypothetical protein